MSTVMAPGQEDLEFITAEVWSSFLDVEGTDPLVPGPPQAWPDDELTTSASVSISGAWRGHVILECSQRAALLVAAALLAVPEDEASEEDVADAVGELVNMIGGNVKSLVDSPSMLSLPHVVVQPGSHQRWPGAHQVCRIDGAWNGEFVSVLVYAGTTETGA